jgi:hypothetical protein
MTYVKTFKADDLEAIGILPTKWDYGHYGGGGNYGSHTQAMSFRGIDFYFSYTTLVAFKHWTTGLVCRKNVWGPTTGKHLGWIRHENHHGYMEGVSKAEFSMRLYNLLSTEKLLGPGVPATMPKELQCLETGELIDGRKDPDKVYTRGRKEAKIAAVWEAKQAQVRKEQGILKRKATIAKNKAAARQAELDALQAERERIEQERVVAALRNTDLVIEPEERML